MRQSSISYEGSKTGIPEFDEYHLARYVGQEDVGVVTDLPVVTKGMMQCSVLILKNKLTGNGLFMHLGPYSIDDFQSDIKRVIELFLLEPGEKVGVWVENTTSYIRDSIAKQLIKAGVLFPENIRIEVGEYQSSVAFRPLTNEILFENKRDKMVTVFTADVLSAEKAPFIAGPGELPLADIVEEVRAINNRLYAAKKSPDLPDIFDAYKCNIDVLTSIPIRRFYGVVPPRFRLYLEELRTIIEHMAITTDDESYNWEEKLKIMSLLVQTFEKYQIEPELQTLFVKSLKMLLGYIVEDVEKKRLPYDKDILNSILEQSGKILSITPEVPLSMVVKRYCAKLENIIEENSCSEASGLRLG